ncbi:hypothetical protein CALCODRAFT_505196, partial [Calocera cornea HHB12733]
MIERCCPLGRSAHVLRAAHLLRSHQLMAFTYNHSPLTVPFSLALLMAASASFFRFVHRSSFQPLPHVPQAEPFVLPLLP